MSQTTVKVQQAIPSWGANSFKKLNESIPRQIDIPLDKLLGMYIYANQLVYCIGQRCCLAETLSLTIILNVRRAV
jgi:hypothetical protein